MLKITHKGDFSKTIKYMSNVKNVIARANLDKYGERGVNALKAATPVDTGLTRDSWYYEIRTGKNKTILSFKNSNIQNGVPIAIILQYGHGTRNGGWVEGRDYINPAIQPIFDSITNDAWEEVTRL
jgi:hypothetical protein